jgi:hypothetical protein
MERTAFGSLEKVLTVVSAGPDLKTTLRTA